MDTIIGKVKKFRFPPSKGRNSFGVAVVELDNAWLTEARVLAMGKSVLPPDVLYYDVCIAGEMPSVREGAAYEFVGVWGTHAKYGPQFELISFSLVAEKLPQTEAAIERWLTAQVAGVGAVTAQKMMRTVTAAEFMFMLSDSSLSNSDMAKLLLAKLPDLRQSQAQSIVETWREAEVAHDPALARESLARRELALFLFAGGMTANAVAKAIRHWGTAQVAYTVIRQNPYMLTELSGIGFMQADKLALASGLVDELSPNRIAAAAKHALAAESSSQGNVYTLYTRLLSETQRLLNIAESVVHNFFFRASGGDLFSQMQEWGVSLFITDDLKTHAILEFDVKLAKSKHVQTKVFLHSAWQAEQYIARATLARMEGQNEKGIATTEASWLRHLQSLAPNEPFLTARLENMGYDGSSALNEEQKQALLMAIHNRVSILTGGPGTGKTTTCRALIQLLYQLAGTATRIALAAPTGKASRRMSQAFAGVTAPDGTRPDPQTIHRTLGLFSGGSAGAMSYADSMLFAFDADFIILDEASMIDESLMSATLSAIRPGTHLLIVGDENQLPSVGAGQVLSDMLASGVVPVTRLHTIYRQRATSAIVANAANITAGRLPRWGNGIDDFFFLQAATPEEINTTIVDLIQNTLPNLELYVEMGDVQVLAPQRNTPCGVDALNATLQEFLNPLTPHALIKPDDYQITLGANFIAEKDSIEMSVEQAETNQLQSTRSKKNPARRKTTVVLRAGDPVMFCRNDYEKKVMNGDTGRVLNVYPAKKTVIIKLDVATADGFDEIEYSGVELDDLALAYAMTVHKSQGSEYQAVVLPLTTSHYMMLVRELIYTAVTRGKKYVFLVGTMEALQKALRTSRARKRQTALASLLVEHANVI